MSSRFSKYESLILAGAAAFATYFCMYAYRKPFTAGMFENQAWMGLALKSALILSQLLGYTASKFAGVKFVSEVRPEKRAYAIVGLIAVSQLALIVFAVAPVWLKVVAMFLNGFPLGMVFGLVVSYLEGRRQTEALSAVLCASFIMSSGVVKSIGQWLILHWRVSEFAMPMVVGFIFVIPTLISIYILSRTPAPDALDQEERAKRPPLTDADRLKFWNAYWPGLCLFILVYVCLTIMRTIRDDFGVEIWRDLGVSETPEVFATSEFWVGIVTTALASLAIVMHNHLTAIKVTSLLMCMAFAMGIALALGQVTHWLSPLGFMVVSGISLYVPYVAFHTTMFERLVAASRMRANLSYLMYLADSMGYLGYAVIIVGKTFLRTDANEKLAMLPVFNTVLIVGGVISLLATLIAVVYFERRLQNHAAAPGLDDVRLPATPNPQFAEDGGE